MKLKKITLSLLMLLILFVTGCSSNECLHEKVSWKVKKEATCETVGIKQKICKQCDEVLETVVLNALGHNYVDEECSVCHKPQSYLNIKIEGNYVFFGEYPQTLKEESVEIITDEPDSKGYYFGSDGERYAKVIAEPYRNAYSFNNQVGITLGKTYFFKVEPIKWQILEENKGVYTLITDLIIDNKNYQSEESDEHYKNNYEYSSIRKWLNEDFLTLAFTKRLQNYIVKTEIDNSLDSTGKSYNKFICDNTKDKIYLLSYSEIMNKDYGFESDSSRCKQLTDFAKAKGCYVESGYDYYNNGYYWLRTPYSSYECDALYVYSSGSILSYWVDNNINGVAPAMKVNLSKACFEHEASDWIVDVNATCTSEGSKHIECTKCKEILDEGIVEILDHNLEHFERKDPTCTEPGYAAYDKCKDCDYTTYKVLPIIAHDLDHFERKDPTCIEPGYAAYDKCKDCDYTTYQELPALGHSYEKNVCTSCGSLKYQGVKFDNEYIYFGSYPQSLKEESIEINLDDIDSDGYYLGSDGERYAKVEATPFSTEVMYFNNNVQITKGTVYYFKVEPIKWKIVEETNGTYKLVADLIIDNIKFNSKESNNYETSEIRKWLNEEFFKLAFSEELQNCILNTLVDNSLESTGDSENEYICKDTNDKVYLLSYTEITNKDYGFESDSNRSKQLTDYAKAKGCYMNTNSSSDNYNSGLYWLRSPHYNINDYVRYVGNGGSTNVYHSTNNETVGVVPSITIII